MKTIKTLIMCITLITGSYAFARGGTGGGGVLAALAETDSTNGGVLLPKFHNDKLINAGNGDGALKAEFVRFIKKDRSEIVFEYGQANENNEFFFETLKQRPEEFQAHDSKYLEALIESKSKLDWVQIK